MQSFFRVALIVLFAARAFAADFSLTIGGAVAGNTVAAKGAVFVVRSSGCADTAKFQIKGTAEGRVSGARKTVSLALAALSTGVYAVYRQWPADGVWVVNLTGSCLGDTAGAIVPIGPKGFLRESSKFFPRAATDAEVEASLKTLDGGVK